MERARKFAAEIRKFCAAHENRELAAKYARYFKEGYDSWGLMDGKHPMWNEQKRAWLEKYRDLGLGGALELGCLTFRDGKYEEGAMAIHFAKQFLDRFDEAAFQKLGDWFAAGIRNWAHTDVLCGELIGPLLENGRIGLAALGPWRESGHKYQRRAVPVAMLSLLKGEASVAPLVEFVRPLMTDEERVVHQGVGWFLREAWKKRPQEVEAFLAEWKDTAPRLIFQYATEKMTAAGKARFRRKTGKTGR